MMWNLKQGTSSALISPLGVVHVSYREDYDYYDYGQDAQSSISIRSENYVTSPHPHSSTVFEGGRANRWRLTRSWD